MATFDMTSKDTAGVSSDSIAVNQASRAGTSMRMVESILDISKITNYSCTNGDIFQLLEIPAGTFVLFAGAEVLMDSLTMLQQGLHQHLHNMSQLLTLLM